MGLYFGNFGYQKSSSSIKKWVKIVMNNVFKKDLYRYYGENKEPFLKKIFRPLEIKYISVFRKANMCKFLPLKLFYMLKLMHLSKKNTDSDSFKNPYWRRVLYRTSWTCDNSSRC